MDIEKVLAELHRELARIDEAIDTLERLRQGHPRRGRPPRWLREVRGGSSRRHPASKPKRPPASQH